MSAHAEQAGVLSQTDARQIKCAVILSSPKGSRGERAMGMASGAQCCFYPHLKERCGEARKLVSPGQRQVELGGSAHGNGSRWVQVAQAVERKTL